MKPATYGRDANCLAATHGVKRRILAAPLGRELGTKRQLAKKRLWKLAAASGSVALEMTSRRGRARALRVRLATHQSGACTG